MYCAPILLTKPTEKLAGPHNERILTFKKYNREMNGRGKEDRKTESDVTGLDDERGLQQVERETAGHRGEWRHWTYKPA